MYEICEGGCAELSSRMRICHKLSSSMVLLDEPLRKKWALKVLELRSEVLGVEEVRRHCPISERLI